MDIINIYIITAKISGLIIFGYIISKAFNQDLSRKIIKYIINLLWYILIPVFVISSVWGSDIYGISAGYVAGGAVFAVSAGILISFLISKKKGIPFKDIALPVAFMNSGYLGLTLNKLVFNDADMAPAAVYNAVVA
ncbi:MAG: hypothetical protein PF545_06065, partial [Elusimicrobia bacterium]|nr:hypothetical protein [Elusimicrobiota bacterium]